MIFLIIFIQHRHLSTLIYLYSYCILYLKNSIPDLVFSMSEKIFKKKDKSEELIQIKRLMEKGRFYEALQAIEVLEKLSSLISHDKLSLLLFKCTCLNRLRLDENALKFAEEAYQESQKLGKPLQSVDALIEMAETLAWLTIHDEALNLIDRGEDLLKNIIGKSPKELMAREASLTFTKGRIYMNKYDYNRGLKHLKKSLTLVEELDVKQEIARTLIFIGRLHFYLGDYDIAIEYYQRGLGVAEEGGSKHYILYTSCLIGFTYWFKGEIDRALEYGKKSLSLAEEINCKYNIIRCCDLIGLIYSTKGYFDRAIEFWEQQMKVAQEISSKRETIDALHHIGSVYRNKGDLDKALSYMEKSLALYDETVEREAIGIPVINLILYDLFELSIAKGNFDHARLYYQQFDLLPVKGIRHEFSLRLFKAQLLKISKRVHNRSKAEKILKQLIDEEGIDIEYYYIASINLCDLLLFELGVTNDLEVLDELQSYITRLLDIAEKTGSYSILCETYLLQAKLSLLTFDIKKAQRFLTQAQQIAERFGLKLLAIKISNEHDELLKQLNMWENLKESTSSLKERMEFARLNDQIVHMVRKRAVGHPKLEAEQPVLFAIMTKEGDMVLSSPFTADMTIDETQFGEFLTSCNTFCDQIFSESFDRVKFGRYTILITAIDPFCVYYMFQGHSYSAQQKLTHFCEAFNKDPTIMKILKHLVNENKVIAINEHPSLEKLIVESFLSDPQKFKMPFKAYEGDESFVFVSYSHTDKLQVYPIIDYLNKKGINIWYDEGIPISENWKRSIVENLDKCNAFLVFITPHILDSDYVRKEISFASKRNKTFFGVYLKETELPRELEFDIADIQSMKKYLLPEAEFYTKLREMLVSVIQK